MSSVWQMCVESITVNRTVAHIRESGVLQTGVKIFSEGPFGVRFLKEKIYFSLNC